MSAATDAVRSRAGRPVGCLRARLASAATASALLVAGTGPAVDTPVAATTTTAATPVSAAAQERADDGLWELDVVGWPEPPQVDAPSFVLVDVTTGQVLAARDADRLRPPASTTKLLTALAVSRRTAADDVVEVPAEAVGLEGATAGLRPGQRVHVDDLLALLLLRSGNDAAAALAIHVGGSLDGFAELLRAEAAVLGLGDVVLAEPHGLRDANRLSARDLAVIGRAVLADARLRPLVAAPSARLRDGTVVDNRNELLGAYPGSTGLKTGMTRAAGWSLVASARRGPRHLVAVVLGGPTASSRFTASAALLDHGFTAFAPPPSAPVLRLRGEGRWLEVHAPDLAGLLPAGAVARLEPALPVEPVPPALAWTWGGDDAGRWEQATRLAPAGSTTAVAPVGAPSHSTPIPGTPLGAGTPRPAPDGPDLDGAARLGAWLSGRVQAGLRAAAVSGRLG